MTFTEAAVHVLRLVGKPLHYKEITDVAIEKELLSHVGKSPEVTMGARLAAVVKKGTDDSELVRVKPGVFALTEWDQATVDAGLADRTPALKKLKKLEAAQKAEAKPERAAAAKTAAAAPEDDAAEEAEGASAEDSDDDEQYDSSDLFSEGDEEDEPADEARTLKPPRPEPTAMSVPVPAMDSLDADAGIGDDERARAELSAAATEIFEAEDDDDEPILGGSDDDDGEEEDDANRRGRRRGRGRGRGRGRERDDNDLPSYTVSDATDAPPAAQPSGGAARPADDRDGRDGRDNRDGSRERAPKLDGLVGNGLADALEQALGAYRRQGSVSIKQLAEGNGGGSGNGGNNRGGRGGQPRAESPQAQLIAAAVRADSLRRVARGQRPRFRLLSGGRLALSEWSVDRDLLKLEREIHASVRRYQEAATKVFAKRLAELPARAQGELCLTVLERLGYSEFKAVKRPGTNPAELHLSAVWGGPSGQVPAAVIIRRDGREIGRERVTELRGTLHHYEQAALGVIVSAGQVLSGAREEAAATGATPVHLIGGTTLATACEEHGLGVVTDTLRLHAPDAEFFEALRSGS